MEPLDPDRPENVTPADTTSPADTLDPDEKEPKTRDDLAWKKVEHFPTVDERLFEVGALGVLFLQLRSVHDEQTQSEAHLRCGQSASFGLEERFKHVVYKGLQFRIIFRHIFRFAAEHRLSVQVNW